MNCPIDGTELKITIRQGVEIDYCPKCRGIWLDRGELDKIIEREAQYYADRPGPSAVGPAAGQRPTVVVVDEDDDEYRRDYPQRYPDYEKRKRKSFLGDLFDIFD
ncbi:MAG: TFIIB-type zinc ribbon-containing protein [Candidatus Flexifilum sp.]|jgi:Zn-finger nucleic acid-binding protein